jgi:DnaJ-class molecular chaperone
MGKRTVRNWVRVDCPLCNGQGKTSEVVILSNGDPVLKYRDCDECMGGGKVNKADYKEKDGVSK